MSWIERIDRPLFITCGNGQTFTPLWKKATKVKEYNTSQFEFSEVSGTLVKRKTPKGRKYGFEIWFQGENNIDVSNSFEAAADDNRPWVISHPLYDRLLVQPLTMNIDNSMMNVTKYVITAVETISDDNPRTTESPLEKVINDQKDTTEAIEVTYASDTVPNATDIAEMGSANDKLYEAGKKTVKTEEDAEGYLNAYNKANSAILNATAKPLAAMRAIQAVINAPALFVLGVKARVDTLTEQFNSLTDSISGITSPSSKRYYESAAGGLLSSMALASVSNTDYSNRNEVISTIDQINAAYDNYDLTLEGLQTDNNNSSESYIPSFDSQRLLNDLINYTVSRLFEITQDARQERSIILEHDDNIINLAHRFYPLDEDDLAIDLFVDSNEIGINELLGLKKGRTIKYYI